MLIDINTLEERSLWIWIAGCLHIVAVQESLTMHPSIKYTQQANV